jgi:hypothetical protein
MIGMIDISIWRNGENLHLDLRIMWTCVKDHLKRRVTICRSADGGSGVSYGCPKAMRCVCVTPAEFCRSAFMVRCMKKRKSL